MRRASSRGKTRSGRATAWTWLGLALLCAAGPLAADDQAAAETTDDERPCRRERAASLRVESPGRVTGYLGCADPTLQRPGLLGDPVDYFYETAEVRARPGEAVTLFAGSDAFALTVVSIVETSSGELLLDEQGVDSQTYAHSTFDRLAQAHGSYYARASLVVPDSGTVSVTVTGVHGRRQNEHLFTLSALPKDVERIFSESLESPSDFAFRQVEALIDGAPELAEIFLFAARADVTPWASWLKFKGRWAELEDYAQAVVAEFERTGEIRGRLKVLREVTTNDVDMANPLPPQIGHSIESRIAVALGEMPAVGPDGAPARMGPGEIAEALDDVLDRQTYGPLSWASSTISRVLRLHRRGAAFPGRLEDAFEAACLELENHIPRGFARLHCAFRRAELQEREQLDIERPLMSWLEEGGNDNCTEALRKTIARMRFHTSPLWLSDAESYVGERLEAADKSPDTRALLAVLEDLVAAHAASGWSLRLFIPQRIERELLASERGRNQLDRYATQLMQMGAPLAECLGKTRPGEASLVPEGAGWNPFGNESSPVQGYETNGWMLRLKVALAAWRAGESHRVVDIYDQAEAAGFSGCLACTLSQGADGETYKPLVLAILSLANLELGREARGRELWQRALKLAEESIATGNLPRWLLTQPEIRRLALAARQALSESLARQTSTEPEDFARLAILNVRLADLDLWGPRLLSDLAKSPERTGSVRLRRLAAAIRQSYGEGGSREQLDSAWFDIPTNALAKLGAVRPVPWQTWRDDAEALVLYSFPGEQGDFGLGRSAFALTFVGGAWQLVDLGDAEALEKQIRQTRRALDGREASVEARLESLGKALLPRSVLDLPKGSRLRIFVNGAAALVPFDALRVEGEYLLYRLKTELLVSSPGDGKRPVPEATATATAPATRLVLGAPSFDCGDGRARPFRPLAGARAEIDTIARLLGLGEAETRVGEAASEEAVKALKSPSILHLATHAFTERRFPPAAPRPASSGPASSGSTVSELASSKADTSRTELSKTDAGRRDVSIVEVAPVPRARGSGLALAGANLGQSCSPQSREDGVLTFREALQLDLTGTRLVVLSACETGVDSPQAGKAAIGLQRAFLEAGAQNVVSTLWRVDDRATVELMTELYRRIVRGEEPSEALRQAKLDLAAPSRGYGPWQWAAFVLTGLD